MQTCLSSIDSLPEVFTFKQLRTLFAAPPRDLHKSVEEGRIPHVVIGGKVLFAKQQIKRWLEGEAKVEDEGLSNAGLSDLKSRLRVMKREIDDILESLK